MIRFGCIADDFTGASDAASFLAKGGLSVQLISGVPDENEGVPEDIQAVVIALKSRTQETAAAVSDTLAAARWLKEKGAVRFYLKYCATFDSTPKGNIGPCADALMEELNVPCTILCPALPVNGRTVRDGCLYVGDLPLAESHMKDHPLTPMWDSSIARLIEPQSKYESIEIHRDLILNDPDRTAEMIAAFGRGKEHFYVIPDYAEAGDGAAVAAVFKDLTLLTGGSGLLEFLAEEIAGEEKTGYPDVTSDSAAVVLAGSCSKPTLAQIAYFLNAGYGGMKMDPSALADGSQTLETFTDFIKDSSGPVIIYSSDTADSVRRNQLSGIGDVAALLESTTAAVAAYALENGFRRIIVAGGETSGAVMQKLGYHSYRIGPSVSPGVPVMIPTENDSVRVVLKSGGFGSEDFFVRALEMTGRDQ